MFRWSQPYSDNESKKLQTALNPLKDSELIDYILNIPVRMAFRDNSFHKRITEYQFLYHKTKERLRDVITQKPWYLFHGSVLGN